MINNQRVDNYLIYAKTKSDIQVIVDYLIGTKSWNPHAKFLIYINQIHDDFMEFASFVYDKFWQKFVINVILMQKNPTENKEEMVIQLEFFQSINDIIFFYIFRS